MTTAITKAKERGAKVVFARARGTPRPPPRRTRAGPEIECVVLLPHGKIALGKLAQALMYGAKTWR